VGKEGSFEDIGKDGVGKNDGSSLKTVIQLILKVDEHFYCWFMLVRG
jgi:hypothetical protein